MPVDRWSQLPYNLSQNSAFSNSVRVKNEPSDEAALRWTGAFEGTWAKFGRIMGKADVWTLRAALEK
jgi:hypothetical protein